MGLRLDLHLVNGLLYEYLSSFYVSGANCELGGC